VAGATVGRHRGWTGPGRAAGVAGAWLAGAMADLRRDLDEGRGFLWTPVALGLGEALYFGLPSEPDGRLVGGAAVAAVVVAVVAAARRRLGVALLLALIAVVGVAVADLATRLAATPRPERQRTVQLDGVVESVEDREGRGYRILLRPTRIDPAPREGLPRRVRVTVRGLDAPPRPGSGLAIRARIGPPPGPLIPGGYDFARVAWFQGVGAVGFALGRPTPLATVPEPDLVSTAALAVEDFRQRVSRRIREVLPGDTGAIAAALIVGDRGAIDPATDHAMRVSGLSHVLSISGLHMALVAACLFAGLRALLAAIPWAVLHWPIKKIAAAAALLGTTAYLVVSGMGVPTQRSAIMIGVTLAAVLLDRQAVSLRTVAVAALAILLLQPEAVLDPGAQMSFASVVALVAGFEALRPWIGRDEMPDVDPAVRAFDTAVKWIGLSLTTSLIAGIATAPIALHHFNRVAPLGLLANLAATPLVSFVIMPAAVVTAFAAPFGLERWPLAAMGAGIDGMTAIAELAAAWTPSGGVIGRPLVAGTAMVVAGGLWMLLWRRRARLLGLPLVLIGAAIGPFGAGFDLVVAGDGRGALVTRADGGLALVGKPGDFEASLWLAALGDPRPPDDASLAAGVACDPDACILAGAGGRARLAVVFRPIAFGEECFAADVVVTGLAAPPWCAEAATVVDAGALDGAGARTYAVVVRDGGGIGLEERDRALPPSRRPWTGGRRRRGQATRPAGARRSATSRSRSVQTRLRPVRLAR